MNITRRTALKTAFYSAGATVGIPLLDCFLNTNGTALASGAPIPVRFGTWIWGCGMNPARFFPKKEGADYDIPPELKPIEPFKKKVSILSGFKVELDGQPPTPHQAGVWTMRTGSALGQAGEAEKPSFDVLIADQIGTGSRFRSVEIACTGNPKDSYSRRAANLLNPSEVSPAAFYKRVFGPDYQDPNSANFTPDPGIMVRRSVLSDVGEQRKALVAKVGASDRHRLDQYFTSLREVENQLALLLEKPAPALACAKPGEVSENVLGTEIGQAEATHKLMSKLVAMTVACNQTRAFNVMFSDTTSSLRRPGDTDNHHTFTHEEKVDPALGYQPKVTWFIERCITAGAEMIAALDAIPEGDGTLLDHTLLFMHSDTSFAKIHSLDNIPVLLAGGGSGRMKTGIHVAGRGDAITRVGFTVMQAMGVNLPSWGTQSMQTAKTITDIVA